MRIISILLTCVMFFTGCGLQNTNNNIESQKSYKDNHGSTSYATNEIYFPKLDDEDLLRHIEDNVYSELVDKLDSDKYFIENITVKYISKEYLEEVEYNSQSNIYFGYTLDEVTNLFSDKKFIFTLGEDGKTTVKEYEAYDDTYDKVLKNVAMGTGVILVCVTVSAVTSGVSPAISVVLAASAKTGTGVALSEGVISGVISGVVTGVQTKDIKKALDDAAIAGSEGFKWGAITGSILGGSGAALKLKAGTLNGLTMKEAAIIQKESKYPIEIVKKFHSFDEYEVFKAADLKAKVVNGKKALVQDIDWNFVRDKVDGRTNAQRAADGYAPLDPTGKPYQLHHIGQNDDSPLAILTKNQHTENNSVLHKNTGSSESEIKRNKFDKIREEFWKDYFKLYEEGR